MRISDREGAVDWNAQVRIVHSALRAAALPAARHEGLRHDDRRDTVSGDGVAKYPASRPLPRCDSGLDATYRRRAKLPPSLTLLCPPEQREKWRLVCLRLRGDAPGSSGDFPAGEAAYVDDS